MQMETKITCPSLYDCVRWALGRPLLRSYTFDELAAVYLASDPADIVALVDEYGSLLGTAIAFVPDNVPETAHISFIATDGSPVAIAGMVAEFNKRFPTARFATFRRRGRLCFIKTDKLARMLALKNHKKG